MTAAVSPAKFIARPALERPKGHIGFSSRPPLCRLARVCEIGGGACAGCDEEELILLVPEFVGDFHSGLRYGHDRHNRCQRWEWRIRKRPCAATAQLKAKIAVDTAVLTRIREQLLAIISAVLG